MSIARLQPARSKDISSSSAGSDRLAEGASAAAQELQNLQEEIGGSSGGEEAKQTPTKHYGSAAAFLGFRCLPPRLPTDNLGQTSSSRHMVIWGHKRKQACSCPTGGCWDTSVALWNSSRPPVWMSVATNGGVHLIRKLVSCITVQTRMSCRLPGWKRADGGGSGGAGIEHAEQLLTRLWTDRNSMAAKEAKRRLEQAHPGPMTSITLPINGRTLLSMMYDIRQAISALWLVQVLECYTDVTRFPWCAPLCHSRSTSY